MPRISEISIQNIRRFNSPQHARLGRITLLVGENSVGKSTFLGCYNAFAHLSNLIDLTDNHPFDRPPCPPSGPMEQIRVIAQESVIGSSSVRRQSIWDSGG